MNNTQIIKNALVLFLSLNGMKPKNIASNSQDDIHFILGEFESTPSKLTKALPYSGLPIVFLVAENNEPKIVTEGFTFIVIPSTLSSAEFYFAKENEELKKIGELVNTDPQKKAYCLMLPKSGYTPANSISIETDTTKVTLKVTQHIIKTV